ncbi:CRISPR-associated endonuclease Cas1 [Streptomyces sp. NPDC048665]|uniref:CRISPR-associated endonuclease Cas1 n=1 Tax=Streptomyces sp. NPDC048665 TaxID=3155490 RepID=UPI0034224AE0
MTEVEIPELAEIFAPRRIGPTLIIEGFGAKLAVERGQLVVHDGFAQYRRTNKLPRIDRTVQRIIITAVDGYVTLDAIQWCKEVGISIVILDPKGELLMTSERQWCEGRLHQVQVRGCVEAVRYIMRRKIQGQYEISQNPKLKTKLEELNTAQSVQEVSDIEKIAAQAYWASMRHLRVNFRDEVPEHWRQFHSRSGRGNQWTSPRKATDPLNAMLNLAYVIGYAESRLACHAMGLDTEVGLLHRPKAHEYSHSMSLDLVETIRPVIDRTLFELIEEKQFRRRDFTETPQGQCMIGSPLDREIIERTREAIRIPIGEEAENVTHILCDASETKIDKRTPFTRNNNRNRWKKTPRRTAATTG